MKAKKMIALSLVTVLAMATMLTGCSPKQVEQASATSAPKAEAANVNIFQFKVEIQKELQAATQQYMALHPEVKINLQTVGGGADYGAALRAQFQSGNEPTIFDVGGPQDIKDWAEKLDDLSDQEFSKQALDGVLSGVTVDGKVYGLPYSVEGYGFVYNKKIFTDAGIDGEAIKDYKSLEAAVQTLDKKIKAGELKAKYPNLKAVFDLPGKETWVTGLHASNPALSQEFKSSLDAFAAKEVKFTASAAYKKLIDLQMGYSEDAKSTGKLNAVDYATSVDQGLAVERVAIVQQGNWIYSGVAKIDENVAKNLGILPMPIIGGKEDSIPVGVPMYWAVNKTAKDADKKAAKDFLNWLYTSKEGKDIIVNKFFFIPPLKGFDGLDPKDSLGMAIKKYAVEGKTIPWVFMGYPTGWGQDVLGAEMQKYFAGEKTWDQVLQVAKDKWKEMRK